MRIVVLSEIVHIMRRFIYVIIALFTLGVSEAQTGDLRTPSQLIADPDHDRIKIQPEDLPQPVKNALAQKEYQDWKINEAYLVKNRKTGADYYEYYEVILKKDAETKTVNLDKDGNKAKASMDKEEKKEN